MHGPSWIALLRRLPIQYHDSVAFSVTGGGEIVVQSLIRLERDFVILRGRMAGSTDTGRVIILPYNQIINLAFQRRMTEPEVMAIFEQPLETPTQAESPTAAAHDPHSLDLGPVPPFAAAAAPGPEAAPGDAAAPLQPAEERDESATATAKFKGKLPSKSILLARLRARLAEQGK